MSDVNFQGKWAMTLVTDTLLRSILISAAESLEKRINAGKITQETVIVMITPLGMRIQVFYSQKNPTKPIQFIFNYSVDGQLRKKWMTDPANKWMMDGPILFTQKGIEVCMTSKQISYTIENADGKRIELALEEHAATFRVNRDVHGKEWTIVMDEF